MTTVIPTAGGGVPAPTGGGFPVQAGSAPGINPLNAQLGAFLQQQQAQALGNGLRSQMDLARALTPGTVSQGNVPQGTGFAPTTVPSPNALPRQDLTGQLGTDLRAIFGNIQNPPQPAPTPAPVDPGAGAFRPSGQPQDSGGGFVPNQGLATTADIQLDPTLQTLIRRQMIPDAPRNVEPSRARSVVPRWGQRQQVVERQRSEITDQAILEFAITDYMRSNGVDRQTAINRLSQ